MMAPSDLSWASARRILVSSAAVEDCKDGSKRRLSSLTRSFEVQLLLWPRIRVWQTTKVFRYFFASLHRSAGVIFVLQADDSIEVPN